MEIIPAIIGADFSQVKEKIEKVSGLVNWVQIDVVDGEFAEPESWGAKIGNNLHLWEPLELPKIEMHLMVKRPSVWLDDWTSTSVDRILIHPESDGNTEELLNVAKKMGTQVGVALKLETPTDVIDSYIEKLDVVQLMSIRTIGNYGALFDDGVLKKISDLLKKHSNVTIEIDGGLDLKNAKKVIEAGANNLVVGSAIFNSENIKESIEEFKKLS